MTTNAAAARPPGEPRVRPSRPDERDALLDLKCRIWPHLDRAHEARRWAWEFDQNPAHEAGRFEAFVVEQAGAIVGLFTMIPHRVLIAGVPGLALDGIDFAVDASLRGQGLGRKLVQAWMDPAACSLAFTTTPTDVSIHLMTGCGGTLLGSVNETVAHAYFVDGAHPASSAGHGVGAPHAVQVHEHFGARAGDAADGALDARFDAEWDELWARIHPAHTLLLVRDARYLRWRYGAFPFARPTLLTSRDASGALSGLAVMLRHDRHDRLYLAELLTRPDDGAARAGLLATATELAAASGLKILFCATRDARVATALGAAGFEPVPGEVPKFLGRLNRVPPGTHTVITEWSVSLGDGDQLYDIGEPEPPHDGHD